MTKNEFINRILSVDVLNRTTNNELYYYTTLDTFINGIIHCNELILWAGHIDYMEDKEEFEKGWSIIKSLKTMDRSVALTLNSIKTCYPYQLSLSLARDSYPMWQIYGSNQPAVMLILDYNLMLGWLNEQFAKLGKCIYEGTKEAELAIAYISDESKIDPQMHLPNNKDYEEFINLFPFLYKGSPYQYEKEIRLFNTVNKETKSSKLKFKRIGNIVKPFKELHFPPQVLKGIMLSPCPDELYKTNAQSLKMLLHHNGFNHIKYATPNKLYLINGKCNILKSEIPIRE